MPEKQAASCAVITYPSVGRHGKNVLANSTDDVFVEEWLSFRAEIAPKSRLRIGLQGPKPEYMDDTRASWCYSIGPINWTASEYDPQGGGRQYFDAEEGTADLKLRFDRPGEVQITALEGASQTPSWIRILRVRAKPRGG